MTAATEFAPGLTVQGFNPPLRLRDFGLIAFDMDSTLINIECVDEIADAVGRKAEVAAITEAAMRGEITDFKHSLRRRVALLEGVTVADMERVYAERLRLNPGAAELVAACRAAGLKTLLVSGGFTFFAERVRAELGIDFVRANVLELRSGPAAPSPAACCPSAGATSATAPKSAAPCSRSPACWAWSRRSASPWATAPTTCP